MGTAGVISPTVSAVLGAAASFSSSAFTSASASIAFVIAANNASFSVFFAICMLLLYKSDVVKRSFLNPKTLPYSRSTRRDPC